MFVEIVDIVRQRFKDRELPISVVEGIESRNAQIEDGPQNRVAFVPSAQPIPIVAPMFIGEGDEEKRQLWNAKVAYDVSFNGFDESNPDRDLAHRRRCLDLFEVTAQEIHRAYAGQEEWSSARWDDSKKHVRHGAELVATVTLNIPIFDIPYASATPRGVPNQPKPVEE